MESLAINPQTDDQKSLVSSMSQSQLESSMDETKRQKPKSKLYECVRCGKTYYRKANLLKHCLIVHSNGVIHDVDGNEVKVGEKRKRADQKRNQTSPRKRNNDVNREMKPKPAGKSRKQNNCDFREIKPKPDNEIQSTPTDSKMYDATTESNDNNELRNRLVDSTIPVSAPLESNIIPEAGKAIGNYFFVDLQNKIGKNNATDKNARLYVLNGNMMTDENTNGECGGIICLGNNLGNMDNLGISVLNSTTSNGECNVLSVPMSSLIPLNQNNIRNLGSNITLNIPSTMASTTDTLPVKNYDGEILRSKLSEGLQLANALPAQVVMASDTMAKMVAIPVSNVITAKKMPVKPKKDDIESPELVKAKSDLIKWKKLLIETAIHPQMPQLKPPSDYTGPTYACEECDDTFISPVGLENHKNRRSVLFTYACPICEVTLEFYNRCTFLIHVRSHDATVKACFLTISIIPANKLNFEVYDDNLGSTEWSADVKNGEAMQLPTHEPDVNGVVEATKQSTPPPSGVVEPETRKRKCENDDESPNAKTHRKKRTLRALGLASKEEITNSQEPEAIVEKTSDVVTTKSIAGKVPKRSTPPKKTKQIVEEITLTSSDDDDDYPIDEVAGRLNGNVETNTAESSPKSMVKCRECQAEVTSLTTHYRAGNRPLKEYHCEQCKFFNPSKCAMDAHSRMHRRAQPYVCPDCGFYFSTMDSFSTHVKQVCFYDFKTIRFKCPQCSLLKPSAPQFDDHLKRHHIRKVFKCSECNTSAYLEKNVLEHIKKNVHPNRPASVVEGFRCMLCPSVLVAKPSINMHVKKHVFGLEHLRYVYICKFCKKFATGRMGKFARHYDQCLDRDDRSPLSEKGTKAKKIKISDKEEIDGDDENPPITDESEADRLKNASSKTRAVCAMCRTSKLNENTKSLFCKACVSYISAENVGTADSRKDENSQRSKRRFKCKLCKKSMTRDLNTITKHYEQDHQCDIDVDSKEMSGMVVTTVSDRDAPRRRRSSVKSQSKTVSSPEIKSEAHDSPERTTEVSEQYREVSSLPKAVAMSAFSLMSKSEAMAVSQSRASEMDRKRRSTRCKTTVHVRNEKTQSNSMKTEQTNKKTTTTTKNYECKECGLSFIVKPSLEKHLIIEHKIYDVKAYYKANNYFADEEEADERKRVAINQCEVCYMQCDSKQNYDKHIRTHGMAFVTMHSRSKS